MHRGTAKDHIADFNHYDPITRKVMLRPDATLFSAYHEYAHAEQHEKKTVLYILWAIFQNVRILGYLATIAIEWDANRLARNAMIQNGIWTEESRQQAKKGLISYILMRNPDA